MTYRDAYAFVVAHEGILGLFALAVIVTMPDNPPASIRALPSWGYHWAHDGLKTFVSFRSPSAVSSLRTETTVSAGETVKTSSQSVEVALPNEPAR